MANTQRKRMLWRGRETVDSVLASIYEPSVIEIQVATNYKHTLFRELHPYASPSDLEKFDTRGDADLLARISCIRGLEELQLLVEPLKAKHATVKLTDEPKITITVDTGAPAAH